MALSGLVSERLSSLDGDHIVEHLSNSLLLFWNFCWGVVFVSSFFLNFNSLCCSSRAGKNPTEDVSLVSSSIIFHIKIVGINISQRR